MPVAELVYAAGSVPVASGLNAVGVFLNLTLAAFFESYLMWVRIPPGISLLNP